jgi:disulfide bond formation protein DsbB
MNITSLIFWAVFVLPLVAFLIWLMRQDKRHGKKGLIVLAVIVIGGIVYMYWKTQAMYQENPALHKFLGL